MKAIRTKEYWREYRKKYRLQHKKEHCEHSQRYRKKYPDRIRKQNYKWYIENRERANAARQAKYIPHPRTRSYKITEKELLKKKARAASRRAIANGIITKEPCAVCGGHLRLEAHHNDHSKPLEIVWFCKKHHVNHHQALGSYKTSKKKQLDSAPVVQ